MKGCKNSDVKKINFKVVKKMESFPFVGDFYLKQQVTSYTPLWIMGSKFKIKVYNIPVGFDALKKGKTEFLCLYPSSTDREIVDSYHMSEYEKYILDSLVYLADTTSLEKWPIFASENDLSEMSDYDIRKIFSIKYDSLIPKIIPFSSWMGVLSYLVDGNKSKHMKKYPNIKLLDLVVNFGEVMMATRQLDIDYTGIILSEELKEKHEEVGNRIGAKFINDTEEQFDLIVLNSSDLDLYSRTDFGEYTKHFIKNLKDGGKFVVNFSANSEMITMLTPVLENLNYIEFLTIYLSNNPSKEGLVLGVYEKKKKRKIVIKKKKKRISPKIHMKNGKVNDSKFGTYNRAMIQFEKKHKNIKSTLPKNHPISLYVSNMEKSDEKPYILTENDENFIKLLAKEIERKLSFDALNFKKINLFEGDEILAKALSKIFMNPEIKIFSENEGINFLNLKPQKTELVWYSHKIIPKIDEEYHRYKVINQIANDIRSDYPFGSPKYKAVEKILERWILTAPSLPESDLSLDPVLPANASKIQKLNKTMRTECVKYELDYNRFSSALFGGIQKFLEDKLSGNIDAGGNLIVEENFIQYKDAKMTLRPERIKLLLDLNNSEENLGILTMRYKSVLAGGQHLNIPNQIYRKFVEDFGINFEGFGSPFNSQLLDIIGPGRYCSAFHDTDKFYSSQGSFFKMNFVGKRSSISTPYLPDMLPLIVDHCLDQLDKSETEETIMLLVFPYWHNDEWYQRCLNSEYFKHHSVYEPAKGGRRYFFEMFSRQEIDDAIFPSGFVVLSRNEKKAYDWTYLDRMFEFYNPPPLPKRPEDL